MKNIINWLIIGYWVVLLLGMETALAVKHVGIFQQDPKLVPEVIRQAEAEEQLACKRTGSYRLVVHNGWDDMDFPIFFKGRGHVVPKGKSVSIEVSKEDIDKLFAVLDKMGMSLSATQLLEKKDNREPMIAYFMSDDNAPEYEKFSLNIDYCAKDKCDIEIHAPINCGGHLKIEVIKGHKHSTRQGMIEWAVMNRMPYVA